ncbi:hypothetical protein WDU94_008379 [Cyamophila willieti]
MAHSETKIDKQSIKGIIQEIIDAIEIEMDVIKKYGFIDGREGMIQFTKLVVDYEKEDKDIATLHKIIRSHFLPLVTVASESNSSDPNPSLPATTDPVPTADL